MDDARDKLVFREEESPGSEICPEPLTDTWKVLIVDDEEEVHNVTRLVLRDLTYAGRPLTFLGAYSAAEARRMLAEHMAQCLRVHTSPVVADADDQRFQVSCFLRIHACRGLVEEEQEGIGG